MFGRGMRIGQISGINISIDYSWLFIFALFVFLLGGSYFPLTAPGFPRGWYWLAAVVTTILFFASVVAHELAHSIVARRSGLPIHTITLFFFGGVSQLEDEPHSPWDEFKVAIVGPLTSVVLAGLFFVLALLLGPQTSRLIIVAVTYLWFINLALAIFNLLPGFPLDGGRVFRAIAWRATGNLMRATYLASMVGQAFGWLFIIAGVAGAFLIRGFFLNGLWFAFIGWFLLNAARSSYQQVVMRESLSQVPVQDILNPNVQALAPEMSVDQLVREYFLRESASALPVEEEGRLIGIISVDDVQRVPRERWAVTPIRDILQPVTDEQVLHPGDDAWDAINRMQQTARDRVLVVEPDGHVDGIVTRSAIFRWLQTHTRLQPG
ncbi:MAG: site-2 protease family protein [Armatimonadota bacterium]